MSTLAAQPQAGRWFLSLARFHGVSGEAADEAVVDAPRTPDANIVQRDVLRAGVHGKAASAGDLKQATRDLPLRIVRYLGSAQSAQAGVGLAVEVHKADDALFRMALQAAGKPFKAFDRGIARYIWG